MSAPIQLHRVLGDRDDAAAGMDDELLDDTVDRQRQSRTGLRHGSVGLAAYLAFQNRIVP